MSRYLAEDSFTGGGDPIRYGDVPLPDKVAHFLAVAAVWLVLSHPLLHFVLWFVCGWSPPRLLTRVIVTVAAAVAWELFELGRWLWWTRHGFIPQTPWPIACDRFSWRDIVAGCAGAAFIALLAWR